MLLVAHEAGGALGVVLNRATEVPVAEVLGDWGALAGDPAVLFEGGPVQPESAICLARVRTPEPARCAASTGSTARSARSTSPSTPTRLRDDADRDPGLRRLLGLVARASSRRRSPAGSWFVFDALPGDAFVDRPDDLWPMVLRRQGGMLAAVAHFPADVALN